MSMVTGVLTQTTTGTATDTVIRLGVVSNGLTVEGGGAGLSLGETSTTAYRGDQGKTAYDHSQVTTGNPHGVTKSDVGLGNVDNTSDANKPVSSATQTALNLKLNASAVSAFGATLIDDADAAAARVTLQVDNRLAPSYETDFLSTSSLGCFTATAVSSGTNAGTVPSAAVDASHMGVLFFRCAAAPNSGYRVVTNVDILLSGGEVYDAIFYTPSPFTAHAARFGFFDVFTTSAPVDGCWLSVDGSGVAQGNNSSNSSAAATGTTFTLSAATYYHARITVNSGATSVLYEIYSDAGTLLWSSALTTSIPTGSGRITACGCLFTNSGGVAVDLYGMDYMRVSFGIVQRGALT